MSDLSITMNDFDVMRRRGTLATVATIIVFIGVLLAGLWWRVQQVPKISADELSSYGAVIFDSPRVIRALELHNQFNQPVATDFLHDKWSVLFYGFTHCPDICPATLRELSQVEQTLKAQGLQDKWQVVMVAVDSERDTAAVLAPYINYFSPAFFAFTGTDQQLLQLAADTNAAFGKVYTADGSYTMDHSSQLVLINPKGHYAGFIKGPVQAARVSPVLQSLIADFDRRFDE